MVGDSGVKRKLPLQVPVKQSVHVTCMRRSQYDKMQKTIVVKVEEMIKHKLYKKYISRRSNFKAHDENNECKIGDKVEIMETRPLSKDKCWRLVKILERCK